MKLLRTDEGNYICPDDPGEAGYPIKEGRRSITDEEGRILAHLARWRRVLEIGTGLAVSTRYLASTAREVVTVDSDPWVSDPVIANVRFLRDVPDEKFDLAFIDGNHQYDEVMQDIARVNAPLIALHDTYLDEVWRAARDSGLQWIVAHDTLCRLTLYRK